MLKIVFTKRWVFCQIFHLTEWSISHLCPPQPTQKKGEKVWTNFSPFLSPDLVILQNRHQILWLIFWLNYYWICPQNLLQISSQYISPNSVTPKNHHWIWWKIFHNISRYLWFKKKLTKIVTIFITKFGDSQKPSPNLVKKNHTLLITKHPSVPSSCRDTGWRWVDQLP